MYIAFFIGLAVYLLLAAAKSSFRIEEGELGVLTVFGAAKREGKQLRTYGPGLHSKAPWAHVHRVNMKEQTLDLSGPAGGRLAMASDGTVLRLDSILRFRPDPKNLEQYIFGMTKPNEHIAEIFTCLLRNKIANFAPDDAPPSLATLSRVGFAVPESSIGSYAMIRRERAELNRRIAEFCEREISGRYGVKFEGVDLVDILPPDELAAALNSVMNAQSEAETGFFRNESECQHRIIAAREGVKIAEQRALAVEYEISKLGEFLARLLERGQLHHYVKRRRSEVLAEAKTMYLKEPGAATLRETVTAKGQIG